MSGFDETPPPSWQEIAEGLAARLAACESSGSELTAAYGALCGEAAAARKDAKRFKAVVDELLPRFDGLVDDITALIPDDYDSDEAVESIILRWIKDVLADRADVETERDVLLAELAVARELQRIATPTGDSQ